MNHFGITGLKGIYINISISHAMADFSRRSVNIYNRIPRLKVEEMKLTDVASK